MRNVGPHHYRTVRSVKDCESDKPEKYKLAKLCDTGCDNAIFHHRPIIFQQFVDPSFARNTIYWRRYIQFILFFYLIISTLSNRSLWSEYKLYPYTYIFLNAHLYVNYYCWIILKNFIYLIEKKTVYPYKRLNIYTWKPFFIRFFFFYGVVVQWSQFCSSSNNRLPGDSVAEHWQCANSL
jgi:hypothetical protein